VERGKLALDIVAERLKLAGVKYDEIRYDLIGMNALHRDTLSGGHEPYEVRVRVAGRTQDMKEAIRIGNEVETLYTNGPAGGAEPGRQPGRLSRSHPRSSPAPWSTMPSITR
jgi:hypothetical protein